MEIRQLKYFVEACKYKNFSKAADTCFVSVQGLSMSIQRLENELGRELFIRSKQGIQITPAAQYLLPRALKLVSLADECEGYFASGSSYQQTIPIATVPGSIEEFAGDVITRFQKEHLEIHIAIQEYFDVFCDSAVANDEVELGFTCGPIPNKIFDAELVASSRHALIVHEDHPLSELHSVSVQALRNLPIAVLRDTTKSYSVVKNACQSAGFEPIVSTFVDNILSVYDLVQINQSAGISTMALFHHLKRPHLRAIPFEEEALDWKLYFIRRHGASLSPAAKAFEQCVLQSKEQTGKK